MRRRTLLSALGSTAVGAGAGCVGRLTPPIAERGRARDGPDDCPSFDDDADRTVCEPTGEPPAFVPERDVLRVDPDDDAVETLRITLRNEADTEFSFGPHGWALHRRDGEAGRCRQVERGSTALLLAVVEPGGTVAYSLAPAPHPTPNDDVRSVVAPLSPGRHAFAVAGSLDEGDDSTRVECVARFRVEMV
jgi:hypothetical protein